MSLLDVAEVGVGTSIELSTQNGSRAMAVGVAPSAVAVATPVTAGPFTMPGFAQTVNVTMTGPPALVVGSWVDIPAAPCRMAVTAIAGNVITLLNWENAENAQPGTVVPIGSLVTPAADMRQLDGYDIRRHGVTSSDMWAAFFAACQAAVTNAGGRVVISPRNDAGFLFAVSTTNFLNVSGVSLLDVSGQGGAIVQLDIAQGAFPFFDPSDSNQKAATNVHDLVIKGDPNNTTDAPGVLILGTGYDNVEHCYFGSLAAINAPGLVSFSGLRGRIAACTFAQCSFVPTFGHGGILQTSCAQFRAESISFVQTSAFAGARNNSDSNIYIDGSAAVSLVDIVQSTQTCTSAGIWINTQSARTTGQVCIDRLNTTTDGQVPAIQVSNTGMQQGLLIDHSQFVNPGGHVGPDIVANFSSTCPFFRMNESTLTASPGFDPALWPKFRVSLASTAVVGTIETSHLVGYKVTTANITPNGTAPQGTTLLYDMGAAKPTNLNEFYDGVSTVHPVSIPSLIKFWSALDQIGGTDVQGTSGLAVGALVVGAAATYNPVVAGHQLKVHVGLAGSMTITFLGTENSQATFIATLNSAAQGGRPAFASANGGQIQLTSFIGYNRSFGTIFNTSNADVLTSLGLAAGDFSTLPRCTTVGENSGHLADANNTLGAVAGSTNGCAYIEVDANANNWPAFACQASGDGAANGTDGLQTPAFTAAIAQPYTLAVVGYLRAGAGSGKYLVDGGAVDQMSIRTNPASGTSLHITNGGTSTDVTVANTGVVSLYLLEVNGSNSKLWVNSDSGFQAVVLGASSLSGLTLGQQAGGSNKAGWNIHQACVFSGQLTQNQRESFVAYTLRRFNIAKAPPTNNAASWHTFTLAPGTANFISPFTGTAFLTWAGGGSGGAGGDGSAAGTLQLGGPGGGGAQILTKPVDLVAGTQYDLTFGAGGVGGTAGAAGAANRGGPGNVGGDSTFVIHAGATLATWPGAGIAGPPALVSDGGTQVGYGSPDTRITNAWPVNQGARVAPAWLPPGYGGVSGISINNGAGAVVNGSGNLDGTFAGGSSGTANSLQSGSGGGAGAFGAGANGAAAAANPAAGANAAANTSAGGGGGAASTTSGNAGSAGGNGGGAGSLVIRAFF